jgi:carbon-monoxide dehydrogenase small subunit
MTTVSLVINGDTYEVEVEPRHTLADILRDGLGLTGTNVGCEHGVCGACTVIVEGAPVRSCLMFAVQCDGAEIRTVEGLADGERLNPLQRAFHENHALQCGFCTPGFLMLATAALEKDPDMSDDELKEWLASNLCRCTGYEPIVAAVKQARDD